MLLVSLLDFADIHHLLELCNHVRPLKPRVDPCVAPRTYDMETVVLSPVLYLQT